MIFDTPNDYIRYCKKIESLLEEDAMSVKKVLDGELLDNYKNVLNYDFQVIQKIKKELS